MRQRLSLKTEIKKGKKCFPEKRIGNKITRKNRENAGNFKATERNEGGPGKWL